MFNVVRKTHNKVAAKAGGSNVEIQETFTALERARHFAVSKLSLQRLVFVNELVDCAHDIGYEATVIHLLPLVKRLADDAEVLVRQSLVGHFGDLAGFLIQADPERGYQKVVDDVLPIVSLLLTESASEVRQGAAEALTTLASHLRPGERGDQVLMTVISMSHNNDDEDARATAVQLLNTLAEALGRDLCRQFVGVGLVALCQDPSFRVRKATASSFGEVARVVGDDYVLGRLLPAFGTLINDNHWGVRKAAAEHLVGLAQALQPESRKEPLVPLMDNLLKDTSRWVRITALQQLGYFVATLESAERVPPGLLTQYVEIIEQTKANPEAVDISYHCAYTFAAVVQAMGQSHWSMLQAPFLSLCRDCRDTHLKTRKAIAASMHVIAQTLGPDLTESEVLPQFEILLQDTAAEVRHAALRNVAEFLRTTPSAGAQRRVLHLLQGAMGKADSWRLRHLAASQLGAICEALGQSRSSSDPAGGEASAGTDSDPAKDLIWSVVVPLFLQLCGDGVAEVRTEAAKATAKALRVAAPELFVDPGTGEGSSGCSGGGAKPPLPQATSRLVRHIIRTFARGRAYRSRLTYVRMCDAVVRESPLHIFTDLFLRPLVRLSVDPVKNVRLCWAITMAPHVRKVGRLGSNAVLLAAAYRMIKAAEDAGATSGDAEAKRALEAAPLAELPAGTDLAAGGPESDLDESDTGEGWLPLGGGTGDSSESTDVGVAKELEEEEENRQSAVSPKAVPAAKPASPPASTPPQVLSPTSSSAVPAAAPFAPPPRTNSNEANSPGKSSAARKQGTFDPVEDELVEQRDIDRDLDSTFCDRRLLHEAEAMGDKSSGHSVEGLDSLGDLVATITDEANEAAAASSSSLPSPSPGQPGGKDDGQAATKEERAPDRQ